MIMILITPLFFFFDFGESVEECFVLSSTVLDEPILSSEVEC